MATKRTVRITKRDIDNAIPRDSHRCMIADAVHRSIPSARYVIVDVQSIRFSNPRTGRRHIYLTPPNAAQALKDFDQGGKIKPFKMNLTQGYTRRMRVREPNFKPSSKTYAKTTGKKKRYMPTRFREFGLRTLRK